MFESSTTQTNGAKSNKNAAEMMLVTLFCFSLLFLPQNVQYGQSGWSYETVSKINIEVVLGAAQFNYYH